MNVICLRRLIKYAGEIPLVFGISPAYVISYDVKY